MRAVKALLTLCEYTGSSSGGGGGGGGNFGLILVRVSEPIYPKPTPIIYLVFEQNDLFIYLIEQNVSMFIYCSIIIYPLCCL